jgi:hypothetical protein
VNMVVPFWMDVLRMDVLWMDGGKGMRLLGA